MKITRKVIPIICDFFCVTLNVKTNDIKILVVNFQKIKVKRLLGGFITVLNGN